MEEQNYKLYEKLNEELVKRINYKNLKENPKEFLSHFLE